MSTSRPCVDVALLAKTFFEKYTTSHGKKLHDFTDKAKRALLAYHWPDNIRELQNMIERGVILAQSGTGESPFCTYTMRLVRSGCANTLCRPGALAWLRKEMINTPAWSAACAHGLRLASKQRRAWSLARANWDDVGA